jgi:hypothetical protein
MSVAEAGVEFFNNRYTNSWLIFLRR